MGSNPRGVVHVQSGFVWKANTLQIWGRDDLDVFFSKNNSGNLLKKKTSKSSRPLIFYSGLVRRHGTREAQGLFWELSPGPLAPKARIMPLDQIASGAHASSGTYNSCSPCQPHGSAGSKPLGPCRQGCADTFFFSKDYRCCFWRKKTSKSSRPQICNVFAFHKADALAARPKCLLPRVATAGRIFSAKKDSFWGSVSCACRQCCIHFSDWQACLSAQPWVQGPGVLTQQSHEVDRGCRSCMFHWMHGHHWLFGLVA